MTDHPHSIGLYLWVAAGGALGSLLRFSISMVWLSFSAGTYPWPTLVANVVGSFLIGYIAATCRPGGAWSIKPEHQVFLMAGFCGGLTTFSFVSLELALMVQVGQWQDAASYTGLSLLGWLLAVWLGYRAGYSRQTVSS